MKKQKYVNGVPQVRPWVRFWARMIDFMLYFESIGLVATFVDYYISFDLLIFIDNFDIDIFNISLFFSFVFVETILLSTWGTTPGKWLLNITVGNNKNKKLNYILAFKRSLLVWLIGIGAYVYIWITLMLMGFAYNQLEKEGITVWDKYLNLKVSHKKPGTVKLVFAIMYIVLGFVTIFIGFLGDF